MYKELIKEAIKARETMTYVPYSNFRVGASVLFEDGKIYSGGNIENAAYTPSNCAERTAIFKGVSCGNRKIKKICVIGDAKDTFPCGVCRQVIREFCDPDDIEIIVANSEDDYKVFSLEEILPHSFSTEDLKRSKNEYR